MEFTRRQALGTKADAVLFELREQLMDGRRPFGETFSTAELAQEFGVSRRPVMDAVMRLESAGFIEIIPQVGCRVVLPDRNTVREHFHMASVLEGAAARLAASNASAQDRREIDDALGDSRSAAAANDLHRFDRANKRLHMAILTAGGNGRLADLARSAWDLSDFYLQARPPGDLAHSHREHEGIVDAIERRDPTRARDLMEAHLSRFGDEAVLPDDSHSGRQELVIGKSASQPEHPDGGKP